MFCLSLVEKQEFLFFFSAPGHWSASDVVDSWRRSRSARRSRCDVPTQDVTCCHDHSDHGWPEHGKHDPFQLQWDAIIPHDASWTRTLQIFLSNDTIQHIHGILSSWFLNFPDTAVDVLHCHRLSCIDWVSWTHRVRLSLQVDLWPVLTVFDCQDCFATRQWSWSERRGKESGGSASNEVRCSNVSSGNAVNLLKHLPNRSSNRDDMYNKYYMCNKCQAVFEEWTV